ncbi:hypothetical protein [Wenxinia marina]|nr:hypothetical protein [Wenxinia marina]
MSAVVTRRDFQAEIVPGNRVISGTEAAQFPPAKPAQISLSED